MVRYRPNQNPFTIYLCDTESRLKHLPCLNNRYKPLNWQKSLTGLPHHKNKMPFKINHCISLTMECTWLSYSFRDAELNHTSWEHLKSVLSSWWSKEPCRTELTSVRFLLGNLLARLWHSSADGAALEPITMNSNSATFATAIMLSDPTTMHNDCKLLVYKDCRPLLACRGESKECVFNECVISDWPLD